MKKILALLTGIVLSITILVAGGCNNSPEPVGLNQDETIKDSTKVTIYLKAVEGEKHLLIYDSNDPDNAVVDTLTTLVVPGMKVVWRRADDSGIKSIKKVGPSERGEIMTEDASTILLYKRLRYRIPDDEIEGDSLQKYEIVIKDKDGNEWDPIDPYLKIPPEVDD